MSNTKITGTGLRIGGRVLSRLPSPLFAVVFAALLGFVVLTSAPVQAQDEIPTVPSLTISVTTTTASLVVDPTAGCDIESLVLEYRQETSDPYTYIANGACSDLTGNEYELTGLTANTEYYVRVSADLADSGISDNVVTSFTTDPIPQPSVTSLSASNVSFTTATLVFQFGSAHDHTRYRYRPTSGGTWLGAAQSYFSGTSVDLTGLTEGTEYEAQAIGVSNASNFLFAPNGAAWDSGSYASQIKSTSFTTLTSNNAPTASASATPLTVHQGDTVTLTGTASDTDAGDTLTYAWTSSAGGNFSSTTALSPTWVAPTVSSDTSITLTLTVNDGTVDTTATVAVAVTANHAPTASALATPTTINQGGTVTLTGTAGDVDSGDTLTYAWTSSAGGTFSSTTALSPTWVTPTVASDTTITLTLTVNDGTVGTSATVAVAVNAASVPQAPTGLILSNGFTDIAATWTAPTDTGTAAISGYHLQYRVKGVPSWSSIDLSTTGTSHLIPSLNSNTTYQVQVAAKNSVGTGPYSGTQEATTSVTEGPWSSEVFSTTLTSVLDQVTGLTVTSPNTSELNADWTDVGSADSYLVQWRRGTSGSFSEDTVTPSEAVISGLWAGRSYQVRVAAKRAGYANGQWSSIVEGTVGSLGQVDGIAVATPQYNQLILTWNAVAGADYYTVKWGAATGTYTSSNSLTIATNTYTIAGLSEDTDVFIQIRGRPTSGDAGAWSAEYVGHTTTQAIGQLDQVSGVVLTTPIDNGLTVTWSAVSNATSYRMQWATSAGGQSNSNEVVVNSGVTHDLTGLSAHTEYFVHVRAETTSLTYTTGNYSAEVSKKTSIPAPLNLTTSVTATTITVSWDAVTGATAYEVWYLQSGGAGGGTKFDVTGSPPATTYTITSLTLGTTYSVWAAAKIGSDEGRLSVAVNATPAVPETPKAPTGLTLTAGLELITAFWTAPVDTGNAIITGYQLEYRVKDAEAWIVTTLTTAATSHDITSLTAGITYEVRVAAETVAGVGSYSEVVEAKAEGPPDSPSTLGSRIDISRTANSLGDVELYWNVPADNGGGISSYDVRYRETGVSTWTVVNVTDPRRAVGGLTLHQMYDMAVRASNAHGASSYSETQTFRYSPRKLFLLGASVGDGVDLYRWDTDHAEHVSAIGGVLGADSIGDVVDMTVVNGRLYVIRSGVSTLYEINLGSYAATEVCDFTVVGRAWGLAELGGTVYLNAGMILHTIDVSTCATSVVGDYGAADLREMAATNGELYSQAVGAGLVLIRQFNLSDGAQTALTSPRLGDGYTALAANGNRLLVGASGAAGNLHYISLEDLSTGRVGQTGLGSTALDDLAAMAVLAIAPPGVPTSVAAVATANSLTVTWVEPSFGGTGGVTGYEVQYKASSVQTWSDWTHAGVAVEAVITGLQAATSYDVRVAATNHSEAGEYAAVLTMLTSAPVVACTAGDVEDLGQVDINSITTETISYTDRSCLGTVDVYPAKIFSFTVPTAVVGVVLDLETSRESGGSDPRLTLVTDPFGTSATLATNNDGGTGTNARITHTLATGTTYYVEAMDQGASGIGAIVLKITVPMVPEVHLRLWGTGIQDSWSPYSSADLRLYGGSIPGSSVFTRPARFEVAVRLDLAVDQPFTLELVGPGGSPVTALSFSALSTIGIGDYTFNRYRTTTAVSYNSYAGGTWEMALTGQTRYALEMTPDPTAQKWRASVNAAQSLAVGNVSGSAVISVSRGLRISTSGGWVPNCGATAQSVTITADDTVYVAPCQTGYQTITLDDADGDIDDTTYSFPVLGNPTISPLLPASMAADTAWHSFHHSDPHTLTVRAAHVDAGARLVVSLSNSSITQCASPVTSPNEVDVSVGTIFYLSACATGTARLELLDGTDSLAQQDLELTVPSSRVNLNPSPADALFRRGEAWQAFQNALTTPVVVSTDGVHGARLALALSNSGNPGCPATAGASVTVLASAQVYVAGCSAGEVTMYVHTTGGLLLETFALDIAATAFIVPNPTGVSIRSDNVWHEFGHTGEDGLYAVVNSGAALRVLAVSASDKGSGNCVLAINNRVMVPAGVKFYLTGCEAGTTTVQMQDGDGDALSEYEVTVLKRNAVSVSLRDPVWRWEERGELHLPGEGMQLEMRNGLIGTYDDRDGFRYEARIIQTARDGKLKILADMRVRNGSKQMAPACTLGTNRDNLVQRATLSAGDTLHIRACTVDYSHSSIGALDLADGVVGELQLVIYRVPTQGAPTLVHFQALTVFANRMVLTTPVEVWRVYHAKYDEDTDDAFSIPVQWAHPPGKAYALPSRGRFLAWVANRKGTTALVQANSDSNIDCVKDSLFRVQNPIVLKMGTGGSAAYAIETCDADYSGVTDVSLYYWRGVAGNTQGQRTDYIHAGNLIARYTFLVSRNPVPIKTPVAETSIGDQATPTPQPTLQTPGSVSGQYIGTRPEIIAAESEAQADTDRIHNITIYWNALDDTDGYEVRIDGALQYTDAGGSDVTYTSSYIGNGFQLEEGKSVREVRFAVRGFKTGTPEGYTTQRNVFVPAHETYHSPWSREYKVLFSESGLGVDLGLEEIDETVGDSVDLEEMGIEGADVIMGAQDNIKELFGDITGLEPDSSATAGLLPLTALFLAMLGAVAIIVPLKVSPMSVIAGGVVFVMIWGVAGPVYFAVPIAMAVMPCILVLIAGAAVIKTKGLT